ncbi:MAG TPA: FG-GAP-like repeat-containing protein, partial [Tepidisphaeraceae bacterium]
MGIFSLGRPRRPHQRSAPPIKFRRLRQAVAYSVESLERRVLLSQYVVTDLGTLGGTSSNAYGINDSLQITGSASTATQSHAFLYSGGSMSDLGLFSGVTNSTSVAFGLNSGGQVVGLSYTGNQQVQHAFRDVGGTMFDIGTPGGLYSVARGINATGQIVGYGSTVGQGDASTGNYGIYHAFVYDTTNGLRDIGTLGGDPISSATGINDSGLVAAASYNGNWRGFIYNVSTTTKTPLQTLGGSQVDPVGINNNGQLAGWSTTAGGQREAFLYTIAGGTILPLGDLGGNDGIAWSLNNAGTVVGQSDIAGSITHAFVYAGGAMADLNSLIPAGSGWVLNAAQSINNNGQIVGYGTIGGQSHAFLLSPGPPSVVSINRSAPATAITAATTVSFAVTFDQTVSGVDPTDFKVVAGGSAAYAGPLVVAGSGSSYTVTINGIHGSGTLQLELVDDDSIKNGSNTPLGGPGLSNGSFMGQSCTILQTYPTVISINRANPVGPSTTANTVSYTVTFSAPVTGVIATDFALSLGGVATTPPLVVTPVSSSVYTVTVNGVSSSGTLGLNLIDNGAIHDFSGNPLRSLPATSASFQAQRTTSVIPVAASVAEADLNGDGKLDVVVNKSVIYNGVSALLGNGDGTFQPARNIAATITSFVTIADVNGDGIPDLATANNGYNNVSVLLGNGDGTFKSQRTFAAGANARCLAVADMNGDGKLDLVTCNYTDNTVSVLLGNGDGTFQSQRTVSVGSGPYSLALADINGDGKTDVAVANRGVSTTSTSVLLGNGDGTFQAQQTIALGARQNAVALADLNGDGKLDLVSGLIGSVGVLLGNGNGTFQAAQTFATGATTGASLAVAVSDVNEDGKPDLVMANGGNETLGILLGNGDGTFRAAQTFAAGMQVTTVGQFTFSVAVGDANGDGKPDLVSANGEPLSSSVSVLLNTGLGAFHGQIYTIQQILPTVLSVNRGTPVGPITSASGVNFTVTFNEAVTGVDPTDFQVVTDGSAAASAPVVVTPVSGSVYTVTLNGVHGNGTVGLNLVDNGSIRDLNGNALQSSAAGAFAFQAQQTFAAGPRPFSVVPADLNADGKPDLVLSDQSGDYVGVLLGNGNGTFQVQQTFASGAGSSYSVASADLNGDGRVDVVSANFTGNTVSVLLGNGNGTLQAPQSFATGARPDWIALADVNGDGKIDLIVANANGNTASVLLGNGNGTFQAQQTFAAGANPWTLAVADANGDGKPDLLVADYLSNSVSVLLGNGDGTFQAAQPYAAGANPYFITASDLNADGIPDLVVANFKGANVSVLLGNGNGSFLAQQTFAVGTKPRSIATADVNGDGRQDLIVGDYSNNTLSVLLGNGNGTFQAQQTLNTGAGSGPWGIAAADLNGDGKVDLIAADLLSASVSVILNGAVGSFTGQTYSILQTFPTVLSINRFNPVGPSTSASSVSYTVTFSTPVTGVVADDFVAVPLGGASYTAPLVVAGSGASYTVTVNGIAGGGTLGLNLVDNGAIHDLAGNPLQSSAATSGTFAPQQTYGLSSGPQIVVATDVNGDGKSDLIVTYANGSTVSVLLGNGDGTFQAQRTFAVGVGDWPVGVADVNGDGKPDLIVGFNSSAVGVLLGNGDGSFQAERTFATGSLGGLRSATVADLNGDGKSDLVIMSFAGPLSVLLGNGDGTFRAQGTFATGGGQCYIAIADVNGDSKPDVVVTNPTSNAVGVLLGNGDGTFQAQLTFSTGLYSGPVAVSDVNGDGRSDLVVGNFHTNSVSVLLGNGNGSFQAQRTFTTGPYPSWVAIADVNGDGKPDLIAANNAYGNNVSVLLGNGDGTFAAQLTFACGTHVNAVAVSDFNGDGKPDLVVTNFGSNTVSVLLGNGADSFTGQLYTILAANKLGFATPPSNTTYGTAIDSPGGVQVAVQDSNGNTVAGDTST